MLSSLSGTAVSSEVYLWLKALHLLAVVLFVGNITVTAVWKIFADRTRNRVVIEFAQRLVILTDWLFTGPAAALLFVSGWLAASASGMELLEATWLRGGLLLFSASGLVWAAILIPVQARQSRLLAETREQPLPERYFALARIWRYAGIVATLLPIGALVLMVTKPV